MAGNGSPGRGRTPLWFGVLAVGGLVALAVILATVLRPKRSEEPKQPGPGADTAVATGQQLYLNYCQQCHGDQGRGDGPAGRFLYPRPRNFADGKFRLTSSVNLLPSDDDIYQVITRGMPGSAMFPFAHLSESDRRALTAEVRQLLRTGVEERVRAELARNDERIDPEQMAEILGRWTTPGERIQVAEDLPPTSPESIARGQLQYQKLCINCHGTNGKGDGPQDQKNDDGMPTRPRDFTRGIFKGGRDPAQLRTRVLLGMPGSPMPASPDVKPDELSDLVQFVVSFSDPAAQAKAVHHRSQIVARRADGTLPENGAGSAWQDAPAVTLAMSPLWWRNYSEPELQVQALHDGLALAIRLTWLDSTRNDRAIRPQDFEDMAAVQLFQGTPEPFLGMGAANRPVDVWLWRATWNPSAGTADLRAMYPNMAVDQYPFQQFKEFFTARAAGNPQADPERGFTGSSLQAKGFGTATMRPKVSQHVSATGDWMNGRWTVVLRRPLQVPPESGLPLAPGTKLSMAFALWDGAASDRNGQKLVSIWHDLKLE